MDGLECRSDTALPTAILLLAGALALPAALLGIAAGQPKSLLALIAPLAAAGWLAARRRTVRVNGQRARILGAIGAIETVVDVTDLKCSAGDPAVFDIDPLYARGFVREYR